ncbi:MAG TPA: rhomboid family intramembrane serine protease, partial [Nocardioidaceae bacterium]|nr:rhomboid family intramembrane serine protease [Nocardioidaceae bacterium]
CGRPICPDCMRQAAVGFQCPSCVDEGRKSTRSGRTTYGGQASSNPARTSQVLIGLNALVWLLITVTGGAASAWVDRLALLPVGRCVAPQGGRFLPGASEQQCLALPNLDWLDGVAGGAYWQLVTSMFTHVSLMHIGFNMLALWFLGPQLEAAIGRTRFLALYLLSGLAGSASVYWLSAPHSSTVGASGAIFGLMGGLLVIAIKLRADYSQILIWLGLNVVLTFVGRGFISWQGHLGGLVGGVLIALVIAYAPRRQRTLWQGVGLGALAVLVLLALGVRTLLLS